MKVGGSYESFWHYNAMDTIATAASRESLLTNLSKQDNIDTYVRKCKAIYPYLYMMQEGIRVDLEGFRAEKERAKNEVAELEVQLYEAAGEEFNYNSTKQIMDLFDKKGIPQYKKRTQNGWKPSTDEEAMIRHKRNGVAEADIILKLRRLTKRISTYLNEEKLRKDGRISTFYKPHGAATGRPSSGANIFDEGVNAQNWPHDLLSYLLPDEGYWYLSYDLSQAENRIVAYLARCIKMIDAFETGKDVHRLTASLIFRKAVEEVLTEAGTCSLGDGTHSERDWGKKANHSLNYDFGPRNFGLKFELPEREAKWVIGQYHDIAYPEIRQNYHRMIVDMLAENRMIENLMGRRRKFMQQWGDKLFKTAYAHIPQSTVADIMDERGLNFVYYNQELFRALRLMIIIHDSIGFQIPLTIPWTEQARMCLAIKEQLEIPLVWRGREFVIPADLSMGLTLNKDDGLEIKAKDCPSTEEGLGKMLQENYLKLISK